MRRAGATLSSPDELRASLGKWFLHLYPGYTYVPFQQERLIPVLERHVLRETRPAKLAVEVHPGCAKSEIGTIALATWYMGKYPGHRVFALSYGDSLAQEFGGKIRNFCQSPEVLEVFPGLKLAPGSQSAKHFQTTQGNEFYASGFKGVITGRRVDLLLIDDPVKDMEEARSQRDMTARFNRYRSIVDGRLRPNARVVASLTRYGTADWLARVLAHESKEWRELILDAENEDGSFLWEEFYGREKYESIRQKDPEVWWSTWRQRPSHNIEHYFRAEDWQTFEPGTAKKDWHHYMICDPALGQNRENDRTSILVFAAGPEKRIFIRDWILDRLDPDQRAAALCRMVRKWHPVRFIYEEIGLSTDLWYLNKEFKRQQITLRPIGVGKRGPRSQMSKDARIRELVSDFREGLLWFPPTIKYTCVNGEVVEVIRQVREEEYLPYRGSKSIPHEDALDCLSRIHEPELRIAYVPSQGTSVEGAERSRNQPTGSWESAW